MDVFEAVRTVLAVRDYQDKPVPPDLVRQIVEAGRLTGSSMNGQPWHFVVVEQRETLRRLGALAPTGPTWLGRRWRSSWQSSARASGFRREPRDPVQS
jgi:nitroreductase